MLDRLMQDLRYSLRMLRKTPVFTAVLAVAPAVAQDHGARADAAASKTPTDMEKMTPEQLHNHCAALMGGKMQGRPKHDHAADKLGHAPAATPPTGAEMKAMHDKCAAKMGDAKEPAPSAKP